MELDGLKHKAKQLRGRKLDGVRWNQMELVESDGMELHGMELDRWVKPIYKIGDDKTWIPIFSFFRVIESYKVEVQKFQKSGFFQFFSHKKL